MKVLYYKDLSREGNDCWINESISVFREFDDVTYRIRRVVSGWASDESSYETTDRDRFIGMLHDILFMEQDELETVKSELP